MADCLLRGTHFIIFQGAGSGLCEIYKTLFNNDLNA
jgi:hypothetical protein